MKYNIFIIVCLVLMAAAGTSAQTSPGTIPFDCPDMPDATFQFHFTRELITLAATTVPFNTVRDLYIQIYDAEAGLYDKLAHYYGENVKAKNWHGVEVDEDTLRLYVLPGTALQSPREANIFKGIFAIVKGDEAVYLLNVVGSIPSQQTRQLLTNLGELGLEIPELGSLSALEFDESAASSSTGFRASFKISIPIPGRKGPAASSPTRFRTADGSPIHAIHIRGNKKVKRTEILETLEAGDESLEKAVETLRKKMQPQLEEVTSRIEEENGKHIAVLTVKERTSSSTRGAIQTESLLRFNRVAGWQLGSTLTIDSARGRFSNGMPTSNIFGYAAYGFGNKRMDYEIGTDTLPFATYTRFNSPERNADKWYHGFGINVKGYRITDGTPDDVRLYRIGDSFDAPFALLHNIVGAENLYNYYLRTGVAVGFRWEKLPRVASIPPKHLVRLTLLAENHKSLEKSTDWHLFNWRSTSKARENPAITAGRMRSVRLTYALNLRNGSLGWYNTFFVERSSAAFGSDFNFTRYQLHLRYAHPFGKHRIRTRAIGSFATAPLPIQHQFTIGGPGILNGYPVYAFAGDRGYLFNIEALYSLPEKDIGPNVYVVLFLDAGQTWHVNEATPRLAPKSAAGIGFQFGESDSWLRLNVAKAFEAKQGVRFNVLWFYSF